MFVGFAGVLAAGCGAAAAGAGGGAVLVGAGADGGGAGAGAGAAESSGPANTMLDALRSAFDLTGAEPWWVKTFEELRSA